MKVGKMLALLAALAACPVFGVTAQEAALAAYIAGPRVVDPVYTGVALGEPVEASKDHIDARRKMTVYDLDGKPVPNAVMVPVTKPGALIPPTATKVLGAALVVKDGRGWRVVSVRYDFWAPKADTAKALSMSASLKGDGVSFRVPDKNHGWAVITASDGSPEAGDLAMSVADFFTRLHTRRKGAKP